MEKRQETRQRDETEISVRGLDSKN
jgi:hypothetical protein